MTASSYAWALVVIAALAANFPFVTERAFGVWLPRSPKSIGFRLLELCVCYGAVGGLGALFEAHAGQIAPQTWEFFAITAFLFLTLAFPGFVYRYLFRRRA